MQQPEWMKKAQTVLLGALGVWVLDKSFSSAWDQIAFPGLNRAYTAILDFSTLGLTAFADSMYREVAVGNHETASVYMLVGSSAMFAGITFGVAAVQALVRRVRRLRPDRNLIREGFLSDRVRATGPYLNFLAIGMGIAVTLISFRLAYTSKAAAHLVQLQNIIAPFVPEDQRLLFRSRAAQIHSRNDFVKLTDDIAAIAKKNNAALPVFPIY